MLGSPGIQIPVETRENGNVMEGDEQESEARIPVEANESTEMKFKGGPNKLHISRTAIERYGPIEGCPICTANVRRGHLAGRFGYNHNEACRPRVNELMAEDQEYRQFIQRHQQGSGSGDVSNTRRKLMRSAQHTKRNLQGISGKPYTMWSRR